MSQISSYTSNRQISKVDNFEKGAEFEDYIKQLFNRLYFNLRKHRKSEKFADVVPVDHGDPDLEMELVFTGKKYRFAVECKWRTNFNNGTIDWAKDGQIMKYKMFQDRVRIPVFIVIGIGGTPSKPEKLFVTPLNNIWKDKIVAESQLIPFKRKPTNKFFYNPSQLRLF